MVMTVAQKIKDLSDWKTISVKPETRGLVGKLCKKNETYDVFIRRLLELRKRHEEEFEQIMV